MPRKAANDFTIPGTAAGERLRPPRDLDKPEAALFVSIVGCVPAGSFQRRRSAVVGQLLQSRHRRGGRQRRIARRRVRQRRQGRRRGWRSRRQRRDA